MDRRAPRAALPLATGILGFLAVLAAAEPRTAPGRETGRLEVVDLIVAQDERVHDLQEEVRELERQVGEVAEMAAVGSQVEEVREQAGEMAVLAGSAAVTGPGVAIVLDDSAATRSPTGDPNDLVVHEQDIQTVVNGLWAAGAEALSINGHRLSSVSAVRCAGNTLLLHGTLQTPPYEILAIGDRDAMEDALPGQPGMEALFSRVNAFGLRLEVRPGTVRIPSDAPAPSLHRAAPA